MVYQFNIPCQVLKFHAKTKLAIKPVLVVSEFPTYPVYLGYRPMSVPDPPSCGLSIPPNPNKTKPRKKIFDRFSHSLNPENSGSFSASNTWVVWTYNVLKSKSLFRFVSAFHFAFAADSFVLPCGLISTNNV